MASPEVPGTTLSRSARLAVKHKVSATEFTNKGASLLLSILEHGSRVVVDLDSDHEDSLANISAVIVEVESAYDAKVLAALTKPIDDPDIKDPASIPEAQKSIY